MSPFPKSKVELWHQYSSIIAWYPKVKTKFVQDCKTTTTAWKFSVFGVFWSKCWKIRTRKAPNTNTLNAVYFQQNNSRSILSAAEAYLETSQLSLRCSFLRKQLRIFRLSTIFEKSSILNIWQDSEQDC